MNWSRVQLTIQLASVYDGGNQIRRQSNSAVARNNNKTKTMKHTKERDNNQRKNKKNRCAKQAGGTDWKYLRYSERTFVACATVVLCVTLPVRNDVVPIFIQRIALRAKKYVESSPSHNWSGNVMIRNGKVPTSWHINDAWFTTHLQSLPTP